MRQAPEHLPPRPRGNARREQRRRGSVHRPVCASRDFMQRAKHATTLGPARAAADEALTLERRLSDLVNAAYGRTPQEVELMWGTAPPRMPFQP